MYSRRFLFVVGFLCLLILPGWLLFREEDPFTSFTLELNTSGSVYIQWKTNTRQVDFEVQRSKDQKNWECIQRFSPQLNTQFTYMDIRPLPSINYYRIRMVNEKEEEFYSQVKSLEIGNKAHCSLWPQPARDVLHIEVPFSHGNLEIIDASGRTSRKQSITASQTEIGISELPKGIYFARIRNGNKVWLKKFEKQ